MADKYEKMQKPKYDCLLFDLDDTLYPRGAGLADEVTKNIQDYMVEKLGIGENIIDELGKMLYANYGTTMAGLRAIGYEFDYDEYHSFVHGRLHYENLKPDPALRSLLESLPHRKVIFTNGDKVHAGKVVSRLKLEGVFESILCFESLNPSTCSAASGSSSTSDGPHLELLKTPVLCKPAEEAFEVAFKIASINPYTTLFFEDSVRNIIAGKRVGLSTVLVGTSQKVEGADYVLERIHDIKEAIPELWEEHSNSKTHINKVSRWMM